MDKEKIHFFDLKRWLLGEMPGEFVIEVFIRTLLIYTFLLLIVKLMGKRMSGQITISELTVMITLGAIVSPVMQLPDRGILFGVVGLLVALFFQRGLNWLAFKNEKVEHLSQGKMSMLIKDGVLILEEIEKTHVTKQQVFSFLREKKITNLGKVKRGYLEACGVFSVYDTDEVRPGLPIFPDSDPEILSVDEPVEDSMMACTNCGHVQRISASNKTCKLCNADEWTKAYIPAK